MQIYSIPARILTAQATGYVVGARNVVPPERQNRGVLLMHVYLCDETSPLRKDYVVRVYALQDARDPDVLRWGFVTITFYGGSVDVHGNQSSRRSSNVVYAVEPVEGSTAIARNMARAIQVAEDSVAAKIGSSRANYRALARVNYTMAQHVAAVNVPILHGCPNRPTAQIPDPRADRPPQRPVATSPTTVPPQTQPASATGDSPSIRCPYCATRLHTTIQGGNGETVYRCRNCNHTYTREEGGLVDGPDPQVLRHEMHAGRLAYVCDTCHAKFTDRFNAIRHMNIAHGEKHPNIIEPPPEKTQAELIREADEKDRKVLAEWLEAMDKGGSFSEHILNNLSLSLSKTPDYVSKYNDELSAILNKTPPEFVHKILNIPHDVLIKLSLSPEITSQINALHAPSAVAPRLRKFFNAKHHVKT